MYRAFHLYGACYPTNKALEQAKTHICLILNDEPSKPLCGGPRVEHIADDGSDEAALEATCLKCLNKYKKLKII